MNSSSINIILPVNLVMPMPIKIFALVKRTIYISAIEPFLRDNGIEIISTCSNSQLAIEYYKKVNADIVLMDVHWSDELNNSTGDSLIID